MIVGIDPGLHGAIAAWEPDTGALAVWDVPVRIERARDGGKRTRLDYPALWDLIAGLASLGPSVVILEDVRGAVRDGGGRAFAFGSVAGALRMAFTAAGTPLQLVPPATWKNAMRVPSDKSAARAFASRIYPEYAHLWSRVKDDGRAEAALLAYYGVWRMSSSTNSIACRS